MTQAGVNIFVVADAADLQVQRAAEALAKRLGLNVLLPEEMHRVDADESTLLLALGEHNSLELRDATMRPGRGVSADFNWFHPRHAARRGTYSRTQPLARALGKSSRTVLDATAGLGQDAALMACMGYCVTAVERSPILVALLEDGLRRARLDPELSAAVGDRLQVINADARDVLGQGELQPDVVYVDPMFPPKRKTSALAPKAIRLVRRVVGEDDDAALLLERAIKSGVRRVVVKRPHYAPPLGSQPTMSFTGKLVRYDTYIVQPPPPQPV